MPVCWSHANECSSILDLQELPFFDEHRRIDTVQGVFDLQLLLDAIRGVAKVLGGGVNGKRVFEPIRDFFPDVNTAYALSSKK